MLRAGFCKKLKGFTLHGNLRLEKGLYHVMLGPNGAGKSLTLRIIAGFIQPDSGSVVLKERDITRLPTEHRGIIYLPQDLALFPHMTVEEHLRFPYRARGKAADENRLRDLVESLSLKSLLHRKPPGLSGGEAQRVAIGRALAAGPEVLLLDEPMSALDFSRRQGLIETLRELPGRFGVTILHVTHDPLEARSLAEILFVMEEGRMVYQGTWEGLFDNPEIHKSDQSPYVHGILKFWESIKTRTKKRRAQAF